MLASPEMLRSLIEQLGIDARHLLPLAGRDRLAARRHGLRRRQAHPRRHASAARAKLRWHGFGRGGSGSGAVGGGAEDSSGARTVLRQRLRLRGGCQHRRLPQVELSRFDACRLRWPMTRWPEAGCSGSNIEKSAGAAGAAGGLGASVATTAAGASGFGGCGTGACAAGGAAAADGLPGRVSAWMRAIIARAGATRRPFATCLAHPRQLVEARLDDIEQRRRRRQSCRSRPA